MKSNRPDSFFKCKETLELLDYLRKSQCTSGERTFEKTFTVPKSGKWRPESECLQTKNAMEDVAKECLELSGFKFKR